MCDVHSHLATVYISSVQAIGSRWGYVWTFWWIRVLHLIFSEKGLCVMRCVLKVHEFVAPQINVAYTWKYVLLQSVSA